MQLLGGILIGFGFGFMFIGFLGLLRYRKFYQRLLSASLIDTAGILLILLGTAFWGNFGFFSAKAVLILIASILVNPLITHKLGRTAYLSGHREK